MPKTLLDVLYETHNTTLAQASLSTLKSILTDAANNFADTLYLPDKSMVALIYQPVLELRSVMPLYHRTLYRLYISDSAVIHFKMDNTLYSADLLASYQLVFNPENSRISDSHILCSAIREDFDSIVNYYKLWLKACQKTEDISDVKFCKEGEDYSVIVRNDKVYVITYHGYNWFRIYLYDNITKVADAVNVQSVVESTCKSLSDIIYSNNLTNLYLVDDNGCARGEYVVGSHRSMYIHSLQMQQLTNVLVAAGVPHKWNKQQNGFQSLTFFCDPMICLTRNVKTEGSRWYLSSIDLN